MFRTAQRYSIIVSLAGVCAACASRDANQSNSNGVPTAGTTSAGTTATANAGMDKTSTAGPTTGPTAGSTAGGTAGKNGAPSAGSSAMASAGQKASPTAGVAGSPTAGTDAPAGDAGPQDVAKPTELPLAITNVDVTRNTMRRFGAPHVAVNPKDPNNIIVLSSMNLGYTRACLPAKPGSDCEIVGLVGQPRGFYEKPGFADIGVFVSFDRGKSFEYVDVHTLVPPGHPEINSKGEGPIAWMLDGSVYIGFNAINWGDLKANTFFPNGGVGVIKSTDGGKTWNWTGLSGTPADWPYGGADLTNGTFYVTSGLSGLSTIGPRSTGDASSREGMIADRWVSSTKDGTTWTEPRPLGGDNAGRHVTGGHSGAAGAFGTLAMMFVTSDAASCRFFLGANAPASCVVFQTSKDAGGTWSRHQVPTPSGFAADTLNVFVAADPKHENHFVAVLLNGREFFVYRTADAGATWSEVVKVSEDSNKTHFSPWVAMSPGGLFGLMWRTYETEGAKAGARPPNMPWSVWSAISKDGGATFSKPLKVSKANSPAPPDDPNDAFSFVGDHGPSGMALDDAGGAYVVWADWSPGERAIFFSAINTAAFELPSSGD